MAIPVRGAVVHFLANCTNIDHSSATSDDSHNAVPLKTRWEFLGISTLPGEKCSFRIGDENEAAGAAVAAVVAGEGF
jgi:hypothetical protein